MKQENGNGIFVADGEIGGRGTKAAGVIRASIVVMAAVAVLYTSPAHAAIFDPLLDILDEATLGFEKVVGGFILLVGLCIAWAIGMKNIGGGIFTAVAVLGFAAMVANNETIASEIGFGG